MTAIEILVNDTEEDLSDSVVVEVTAILDFIEGSVELDSDPDIGVGIGVELGTGSSIIGPEGQSPILAPSILIQGMWKVGNLFHWYLVPVLQENP